MPELRHPLNPDNFTNFGELLRYLRERAQLTQRELAALVGYHFSFISYLEKNMRTLEDAALLGRFVPALGVEDDQKWISRLLELSKQKRDTSGVGLLEAGTIVAAEENRNKLPVSLTSMIGREYESARLRKMILNPSIRLVSLLGPPGVGKTCLALNVARAVQPAFKDGVVFVDLTSIRESQYLQPAIASALGITQISRAGIDQAVLASLRDKNLLLVLDNFEQVIEAAPQLLLFFGASSGVKILVTSREVLRLRGEQELHLVPLPTPPSKSPRQNLNLLEFPSVELFVKRAQAVKPEFKLDEKNASLVAEICSRLDGLPLAIELAAARMRTMSLVSMIEQFSRRYDWLSQGARDLPEWRQTLAGAVEWSVNLLTEPERTLFYRLSIFSGGWTLAAAEEVCSDDQICLRPEIFTLLIHLMEKSLILPEDVDGRFSFLETLREYAHDGLIKNGGLEPLRKRHFEYYLGFMKTAKPYLLQGGSQILWLSRVELEYPNLRLALGWATENRERASLAMELGMSIHYFWLTRSYIREARYWLEQILALDTTPGSVRANLLRFSSDYASMQGDYSQAKEFEQEAMEISKVMGDETGIFLSMDGMAMLAGMQGDYATAASLLEEVLKFRKQRTEFGQLSVTLNNLAIANRRLGNLERAEQLFVEAAQLNRKSESLKSLSHSLTGLAEIYIEQGRNEEALKLLKESVDLRASLLDMKGLSNSLWTLATLMEKAGNEICAVTLLGASSQLREKVGISLTPASINEYEDNLDHLRITLGQNQFETAWFDGQTMSLEQMAEMVRGL